MEGPSPWVKGAAFVVGIALPLFLGGVGAHFAVVYKSLERSDIELSERVRAAEERIYNSTREISRACSRDEAADLQRQINELERRCDALSEKLLNYDKAAQGPPIQLRGRANYR